MRAQVIAEAEELSPSTSSSLFGPVQWLGLSLTLFGLHWVARYDFVLFHTLVEVLRVIVLGGIFVLAWHTRRWASNAFLLVFGIAAIHVAALELLHTLSYRGLELFAGYDANLPTQLWVAFRYLESLSLLLAAFMVGRRVPAKAMIVSYASATLLLAASIFFGVFPDSFIEGEGLTSFKIASEYLIIAIFLAASLMLHHKRAHFDREVMRLLQLAMMCGVLTSFAFTRYADVFDIANEVGHYLLFISTYLVYRAILVTGLVKPVEVLFREIKDREGRLEAEVAARTASLRDSQKLNQAFLDNSPALIFLMDARQRYTLVNRAYERFIGRSAEQITGRTQSDLFEHDVASVLTANIRQAQAAGKPLMMVEEVRAEGRTRVFETAYFALQGEGDEVVGIGGIASDVTERRAALARIEYLAHYDQLTDLPNRALFEQLTNERLAQPAVALQPCSLLYFDLDDFKVINDTLGHAVGDRMLCQVATTLRRILPEGGMLGRIGGDEFIALVDGDIQDELGAQLLDDVLAAFAVPMRIDEHELVVTTSIGAAVYPAHGTDFEGLFRCADTALFVAKAGGRNTFRCFDDTMQRDARERLALLGQLRHALDNGELRLYYQPLIDIASRQVVGAEALLRWAHPEHGLIGPDRFIPLAEDSGLIVPIGRWVLREACSQLVGWRQAGLPPITVAVNLSAVQFRQPDLYRTVATALSETGLEPGCLELELTESVLLGDVQQVVDVLAQLKSLGIGLAIDDFGTGYSNLAYLKRFAVDKLKIDRDFVSDMAQDADSASLVRAIVQMARSLGLKTVAEGVEDASLVSRLQDLGCDQAQGYGLGRPMPPAEFLAYRSGATR